MPHRKQQALTVVSVSPPMERAAAYVRMSHESQEYSPHNQMTLIRQYAATHYLSIVRTYSDEGISGLRIENRPGLRTLLSEIVAGRAHYSKLLVYDVSRWGRFQDIDESAYYEFICRRQGVDVIYCAEPFGTDNSLFATIGKVLKRGSAAEYSRELSVRSFRGACNIAGRGFALGGIAPYGLRKSLVAPNGKLVYGPIASDTKLHVGYRMTYVPGPTKEVRVIKEMFRRYVRLGESTREIADFLNASGGRTMAGHHWHSWVVLRYLRNEKYVGTMTYAKTSQKLQTPTRKTPSSQWIRKENAFEAIVDSTDFQKAQARIAAHCRQLSNEELLDRLRRLLKKRGTLSQRMITRDPTMPDANVYYYRFGSLYSAFRMVGYTGRSKYPVAQKRFQRRGQRMLLMEEVQRFARDAGLPTTANLTATWFCIGKAMTCTLQLVKCHPGPLGKAWHRAHRNFIGKRASAARFHLVACLDLDEASIAVCYLVPQSAYNALPISLRISNNRQNIDQYRFADLASAVKHLVKKALEPDRPRSLVLRQLR